MKYLLLFGFCLPFLLLSNRVFSQNQSENQVNTTTGVNGNTLHIVTSPELKNVAEEWIKGYSTANPGTNILVKTTKESEINEKGSLCILSSDDMMAPSDWKICIGHNVIVPVINAKNPMIRELADQGLSANEFESLLTGTSTINWSELIKGGQNKTVNQYIIDNDEIMTSLANFIQKDPAVLKVNLIANPDVFLSTIQNDAYAIGFCRLSDIRKAGSNEINENIRLLPIDKNGNGRIDNFESIYNSPNELSRGVWIGKYPHALSGNIYAMSREKPTDKDAVAFLSWIMSDGGKCLVSNGYSDLISMEKQANLAALSGSTGNEITAPSPASLSWLFILAVAIISTLIVLAFLLIFNRSRSLAVEEAVNPLPVLNLNTVISPDGFYYDKTHTWAFLERDGMIRLGVGDFLLHVTGTITRVTMKESGEFVRRGDKILTLTKFGKQLNLYSPISGIIKARNTKLNENSSLMNNSPYGDGWVYLVEPKNWLREIQFMWMGEKHREWLKDEFMRLRNFFEGPSKAHHANLEFAILQDGGELRDNLLAEQGPEVWEEFQRKFIDPSR